MDTSPRIGLLGGSFDPVHRAHIALALAARDALQLDQVRLLPAAQPWQRQALTASAEHRLSMLELAVASHAGLCVDASELERGGKTYTVDTVAHLPDSAHYVWIMGSDQLHNFCTWHRWQDIARLARLVVAQRPGIPLEAPAALMRHLEHLQRPLITLPFAPMPVSATGIRHMLAQEQNPSALLPAPSLADMLDDRVLHYIREEGLYRHFSPSSHLDPPAPAV